MRVGSPRISPWIASVFLCGLLLAHEGHVPITLKGVRFERGRLHTHPKNRTALDLSYQVVDFLTIQDSAPATGRVVIPPWATSSVVAFPLEGRLARVGVKEGDIVQPGDAIAFVESEGLDRLQRTLIQAADLVADAEKQGGVERIIAESNLAAARVALELASGMSIDPEEVIRKETPVPGVELHAETGGRVELHVQPGGGFSALQPLLTIRDPDSARVEARIPQAFLSRVWQGRPVEVEFPEGVFAGKIEDMGAVVDGALSAWIRVQAGHRLEPGLRGRVRILLDIPRNIFAVPAESVIDRGAESFVLVRNDDDTLRKVNVIKGRQHEGWVELKEGPYPGEQVVVRGAHELGSLYLQNRFILSAEARKSAGVKLGRVLKRPIRSVSRYPAQVTVPEGAESTAVSSVGGLVTEIRVSTGQTVQEGHPLMMIRSPEADRLQQEYIRGLLRIQRLEEQLALVEDAATRESLDAALQPSSTLRTRLLQVGFLPGDVTNMDRAWVPASSISILSPANGVVTAIATRVGHRIGAAAALVTVQNQNRLQIRAEDVAPSGSPWTARVELACAPGRRFEARPVSPGVAELELYVEGAFPGMTATLNVQTAGREALSVPVGAIHRSSAGTFIFVARERGEFERVPVSIGRSDLEFAELLEGPASGTRVAVGGLDALNRQFNDLR